MDELELFQLKMGWGWDGGSNCCTVEQIHTGALL